MHLHCLSFMNTFPILRASYSFKYIYRENVLIMSRNCKFPPFMNKFWRRFMTLFLVHLSEKVATARAFTWHKNTSIADTSLLYARERDWKRLKECKKYKNTIYTNHSEVIVKVMPYIIKKKNYTVWKVFSFYTRQLHKWAIVWPFEYVQSHSVA